MSPTDGGFADAGCSDFSCSIPSCAVTRALSPQLKINVEFKQAVHNLFPSIRVKCCSLRDVLQETEHVGMVEIAFGAALNFTKDNEIK